MNITLPLLRSLDACAPARDAFTIAFPDGLTVTGEPDADAIARVVAAEIDVDWLCERVLKAVAWAEYERVGDTALAEYERVEAIALAEYERVEAIARDEYQRATAPAWAEYQRAEAVAAWRLLADDRNIKSKYGGWS